MPRRANAKRRRPQGEISPDLDSLPKDRTPRKCRCEPPQLCVRHFQELDTRARFAYRQRFGSAISGPADIARGGAG
jgi:hypothetical protein